MAAPDQAQTTAEASLNAPTGPALRLAGQRSETDPIPFERRHAPRMTDGRCGLAVLANEEDGSVAIAPVTLCDTSDEGIGLISRIQPHLGQTARLMIPGAPYDGADARIVRVTPEGDAWRVGMRIRRRMAA